MYHKEYIFEVSVLRRRIYIHYFWGTKLPPYFHSFVWVTFRRVPWGRRAKRVCESLSPLSIEWSYSFLGQTVQTLKTFLWEDQFSWCILIWQTALLALSLSTADAERRHRRMKLTETQPTQQQKITYLYFKLTDFDGGFIMFLRLTHRCQNRSTLLGCYFLKYYSWDQRNL